MKALERKLFRDLRHAWAQAVTIALVVACGIASFVSMRGTWASLVAARDRYYEDRRFADVFAHLERAPESAASRLGEIDGVARVETRVVRDVLLPMPGVAEPALGHVVTLPGAAEPALDALHLDRGRMVEPGRNDEVVVLESFADAHHLDPGDTLPAILNGTRRELRIVGIAMSPEFVFALPPGSAVFDPSRFGVLWMDRSAVAPLFRMEGSFDDVVFSLQPGADVQLVIAEARRQLEPHGILYVVGRDGQTSHHVLEGELAQLQTFAAVTPAIFLGVAAFLLNVVLARMLHLQRGQIATMKALGYRNREIAVHYVELVSLIVLAGSLAGTALGALLGHGMVLLYRPYFRFPELAFELDAALVAIAASVSFLAGLTGALGALARALRIAPAEGMSPEAPRAHGRRWIERIPVHRILGTTGRMVFRELTRRPVRALLSSIGVAWATAIVITGIFIHDSLDLMMDLQFDGAQREDVAVSLRRPVARGAVREARLLPGVIEVEGRRSVPVRIRFEQRFRDTALTDDAERALPLRSVATWPPGKPDAPNDGVALGAKLAEVLGVRLGDEVVLELLEGERRSVRVRVEALVDDVFGLTVQARRATIDRLLREEGHVTALYLTVDRTREDALVSRLVDMPNVAAVTRRSELVRRFAEQTRHVWITTVILTAFGAVIAFGVVDNQARIALSTRARELASLRVLGFTKREVAGMLFGELAVFLAAGIPAGLALGQLLVDGIMTTADPEGYRMPAIVSDRTYALAAITTIAAGVASALAVRRKLDRLDLVEVLKTRE